MHMNKNVWKKIQNALKQFCCILRLFRKWKKILDYKRLCYIFIFTERRFSKFIIILLITIRYIVNNFRNPQIANSPTIS